MRTACASTSGESPDNKILHRRRIDSIGETSYLELPGPRIMGKKEQALRQRLLFDIGGTYVVLDEVGQTLSHGVSGGVNSAASIDLCVDVGYVALNGSNAYDKVLRDFTVASTPSNESQHIYFARCKPVWITHTEASATDEDSNHKLYSTFDEVVVFI